MNKHAAILATAFTGLFGLDLPGQEPAAEIPFAEFKQRRVALMQRLETGIVVVRGNDKVGAGLDALKQSEDFFYLTGIRQPNAALILFPASGKDILFVEPYSRFTARWEGARIVPSEEHAEKTRFSDIRAINSMQRVLRSHFSEGTGDAVDGETGGQPPLCWTLHERAGRTRGLPRPATDDAALREAIRKLAPDVRFENLTKHVHALRGVKSPEEIRCITAATKIACAGIAEAMKSTEPGIYEFQIGAAARYVFHRHGAREDAYAAIVGAGINGCVLHYKHNSKKTLPGELVVMDYAPKVQGYASDVTRTFPTSGTFTPEQRKLVQDVHDIQQILIGMIRPGCRLSQLSARCSRELRKRGYASQHGPSHHVGLNVHDVGGDVLKPGMLLTVEPGAYLPKQKMGCRIEDVILVTAAGHVNLSGHLPSLPDDIEKLMRQPGIQQTAVGLGK